MVRRVVGVAVALCLSSTLVSAQTLEIRITTESANVYKSPSTGSPIIGTTRQGARLEVTRELGSWVKVVWPQAQDGIGYVHVTMGTVAVSGSTVDAPRTAVVLPVQKGADPARTTVAITARQGAAQSAPAPSSAGQIWRTSFGEEVVPNQLSRRPSFIKPPTHIVGLGARIGSSVLGYGATARAWRGNRLGVQFDVSRSMVGNGEAFGRWTSLQLAPSVMYSPSDHVTDVVWLRPYVGAGISLNHLTLAGASDSPSDNSLGFQVFGGSELTIPNVPRFALSVDLGYRRARSGVDGFNGDALGVSVLGHWYMK